MANETLSNKTHSGLLAESLTKSFSTRGGELTVLRDASLRLDRGHAAAIMGPSGSGKSTLLNILGTLESPTSGRVAIDGSDPFALSPPELARFRNRHIGFIFQEHHLLPQCTALENVLIPTLVGKRDRSSRDRATQLLDRVGLSRRLDHRPGELSGGERQRAAIARSLINQPALLLADEPTGNLDRATANTVTDLLCEVFLEENAVLIVVTHSEKLAERFEHRWELVDGRLTTG